MNLRTSPASLCALPEPYAARLAALAPSIAFSVSRTVDRSYRWDGDGPDPVDEGFDAYDLTVTAAAILDGKQIEGEAHLGGSYFREDEPTGEIGGYLNQMLDEAAEWLLKFAIRDGGSRALADQVTAARAWLSEVRTAEWEAQQARRA